MSEKRATKRQAQAAYKKAGVLFEFDGIDLFGLLFPGKLTETDSHGFNLGPAPRWPNMPEFWADAIEKLEDMKPFKNCECAECKEDLKKIEVARDILNSGEWVRVYDGKYTNGFIDTDILLFLVDLGEAETFDNQGVPMIRKK